jgi:outer membrane protein OmpA-like peptidoglycan-associated protein
MISTGILFLASGLLAAQAPQGTLTAPGAADQTAPFVQVTVVSRTIPAVNYAHHGGATRVDFRGTELLRDARGEARVNSRPGATTLDVRLQSMTPAHQFGAEYLTYVLWAITPEGRTENLGELILDRGRSRLETTTPLQAFGLVVTAEPYFAVTQPSNVVVLENVVRAETSGALTASYRLLQRGVYVVDRARFEPVPIDPDGPLQLAQAENAVQIARLAGADRYAAGTLARAIGDLENARRYWEMGRHNVRAVRSLAMTATQTAEDARAVAFRQIQAQRQEAERAAAEQARQDATRSAAEAERAQADRVAAEQARAEAERARTQAEQARREAESMAERAQADRAAAEADAARARADAQEALGEREEMRRRLVQQLGTILETRETARGVVATIGDVLFDFDRATLRPAAREQLAKVTGVLLAYPGLRLRVEGHTDSVGSEPYNMKLSQARAEAVRNYLVEQGVRPENVMALGYGQAHPVAGNQTAEGRQQNRRVEVVVTGDVIGIPDNPGSWPAPPQPAPTN